MIAPTTGSSQAGVSKTVATAAQVIAATKAMSIALLQSSCLTAGPHSRHGTPW